MEANHAAVGCGDIRKLRERPFQTPKPTSPSGESISTGRPQETTIAKDRPELVVFAEQDDAIRIGEACIGAGMRCSRSIRSAPALDRRSLQRRQPAGIEVLFATSTVLVKSPCVSPTNMTGRSGCSHRVGSAASSGTTLDQAQERVASFKPRRRVSTSLSSDHLRRIRTYCCPDVRLS